MRLLIVACLLQLFLRVCGVSELWWPFHVQQVCGVTKRNIFTIDGSETLQVPSFCSSENCRSAISWLELSPEESRALDADFSNCGTAGPEFTGDYTLLRFTIHGYDTGDKFALVTTALDTLPEGKQEVLASSHSYIKGVGVQYIFSLKGTASLDAGHLTANALTEAVRQSTRINNLDILAGTFAASKMTSTWSLGDWAIFEIWEIKVAAISIAVFASIYTLAALLALAGIGPSWLPSLVLCWPELCNGQGCIVYRCVCCPFVVCYNAMRIFCCTCFCTYCGWACFPECCKGICWRRFEDKDFPPNANSIGSLEGDVASGVLASGSIEWARASDIAENKHEGGAQLFDGDIEAADLLQGQLGDCWLIAALACVAERPEVLQQCIISKTVDPRGKYTFRLWDQIKSTPGTQWKTIVIDDYIPVQKGTLIPKFSKPHDNEMWAMLIEKAFAKMYGDYGKLEGGQMSWALSALTGNSAIHFYGQNGRWQSSGSTVSTLDNDKFFDLLRKANRNGAFICCASIIPADKKGLINGHAYSILQLRTVHKSTVSRDVFRMVQIRNPHGRGEWRGAWSDKSSTWNEYPRVKSVLQEGEEVAEDGSFWMQWEDFTAFWGTVQVVDCATNIRSVATPVYDEYSFFGPIWACLQGCFYYWCCCMGCFKLYCGRASARDVEGLKKGVDQQCGIDQKGFFCECCDREAHYRAVDDE